MKKARQQKAAVWAVLPLLLWMLIGALSPPGQAVRWRHR
jgi:hypothetical protein